MDDLLDALHALRPLWLPLLVMILAAGLALAWDGVIKSPARGERCVHGPQNGMEHHSDCGVLGYICSKTMKKASVL
jgi:hypothetical protein